MFRTERFLQMKNINAKTLSNFGFYSTLNIFLLLLESEAN